MSTVAVPADSTCWKDYAMDRLVDCLGLVPALVSAWTVMLMAQASNAGLSNAQIEELFESKILTLVCIVGASFGGLFNLYFFEVPPDTKNPAGARMFQFGVSGLLGVCFASPILHWTSWELNITWVLLVSAMSATFGIMLIRGIMPTLKSLFSSPLEKLITFLQSVRGK